MGRKQTREVAVERLRAALPVRQYLFLMHQAAVTGWIPTLDNYGRPIVGEEATPQNTLSPKDRMNLLGTLVDKVMGPAKSVDVHPTSGDDLVDDPSRVEHMTTQELAAIAHSTDADFAIQDSESDTPTDARLLGSECQ